MEVYIDRYKLSKQQKNVTNQPRPLSLDDVQSETPPECSVWGALSLTLRISRWFGVAPVKIVRRRGSVVITASPVMRIYSYLIIMIVDAVLLAALILDIIIKTHQSVCSHNKMTCVVTLVKLISLAILANLEVFTAPTLMERMISCLNHIDMIIFRLTTSRPTRTSERCRCILIIAYLIVFVILCAGDLQSTNETFKKDKTITCLYIPAYINRVIVFLLQLQYVLVALSAHDALRIINDVLVELIHSIESKTLGPREQQATLRRLVVSYTAACDVVRQVDASYAVVLVMLLLCLFVYAMVSAYYTITFILRRNIGLKLIMVAVGFGLSYIVNILMIVEPGYRTQKEMDQTQALLSQLMSRPKTYSLLTAELEVFYHQVMMTKAVYSPLGVCMLTRPLVVTIFGTCTTYLVIALQFHAVDGD